MREGAAKRQHPEALLQELESRGLALLGLLQKDEHELNAGHPQGSYSVSTKGLRPAPARSGPFRFAS